MQPATRSSLLPPALLRARLTTDIAEEVVELTHAPALPGAQFWRVEGSQRHWSMLHDTFTACLVQGPGPLAARWVSRGEERSIARGQVQLMEPGEVHRTTHVSEPAAFFVVWWSPELMLEVGRELGVRGPIHFGSPQSSSPELARALARLAEAVNEEPDAFALESAFAAATDRLLALGVAPAAQRQRRHPSVRRAVEYLHDAFDDTVTLDELARETRLSKFHFARSFRATTGVAPHQYQSLLRLQAARRHLERGVSVEESAALAGFADGPHLTRKFRRWVGVAPGAWSRASPSRGGGMHAP